MEEVEQWLDDANRQRSEFEQSLRDTELALQSAHRQQSLLQNQIEQIQLQSDSLLREREQVQARLTEQAELVRSSLRRVYLSGRQGQLRLLLSQRDPAVARRMLEYQRRLSVSRLALIEEYDAGLNELATLESGLRDTEMALESRRNELAIQNQDLNDLQETRRLALAGLDAEIDSQLARREKLAADRAVLEALLERIDEAVEAIPRPAEAVAFASLKGQLTWPAKGQLVSRFDDPYGDGSLRRQGVIIAGLAGETVHAVHSGRVVFADWLRGYGLLTIIDHGDGYMSLYGYNQDLAVNAGDTVASGDVVATIGNSGGQTDNGVYFEIRHSGRPQNPNEWFSRALP